MNSIGKNIVVTLFGESHSNNISIVLKGIKSGYSISLEDIQNDLYNRNPKMFFNTQRKEDDEFEIISGLTDNTTNGEEIVISIKNKDVSNKDYSINDGFLRPGHSDYTRYLINSSFAGGGMSSGRMTVALVAAGSICKQILKKHNINIVSHIQTLGSISEESFLCCNINDYIEKRPYSEKFQTITKEFYDNCMNLLERVKNEGNGVGSIVETAIVGSVSKLGSPFFDSVESILSHYMFSIPGVKGIEFGLGFGFANKLSTEVLDSFILDNENNIVTTNNFNGGINGGIANGMPIIFKTALKPVPTIKQELTSLNIKTNKVETVLYKGNHDVFYGNRALIVINALTAIAILDMLYE